MSKPKLTWTSDALRAVSAALASVRDLGRDDIKVAFQPIVDIETGRIFAHEALARCQRPGLESPLVLFTRATEEQACGRLGRLIRDVAFSECSSMPLFVNLHPDELSSRWLIQPDDPLGFHTPPVYLEVTEAAAFTHFDLCSSVLMELCARTGAHLVVDDFGAGYSNIQRILDLEPAIVKLDLALVRDIDQKPRQRAVVAHMVALCADLGCKVVAEGIESVSELLAVRDLGVHYAQGYLLAKPAFTPPEVRWPAEMGRVLERSLSPRRSVEPQASVQRRSPTIPAGAPRQTLSTGRVLVEEVVLISHSEELRPRPKKSFEPARPVARRSSGNKLPNARSEAPTLRPKSPGGRSRSTTAPEARVTRAPAKKTTSNKSMRKTKAPPR